MASQLFFKRDDLSKWMNGNNELIQGFEQLVALLDKVSTGGALPPIGYVYTQGPDDMAPSDLWPSATWNNVSSEEAGSFRRFEGGSALDFAAGQQGHSFQTHGHNVGYDGAATGTGGRFSVAGIGKKTSELPIPPFVMTEDVPFRAQEPISNGVNGDVSVSSETRPINYTVRKWRRTA